MSRVIRYETRDGKGNQITKDVPIKAFAQKPAPGERCAICGKDLEWGVHIEDAVSSNFTDWAMFERTGTTVCEHCAQLLSLYAYSYIYHPVSGDIDLINAQNLQDAILTLPAQQTEPWMFCITVSRKKHLFYRAQINNPDSRYFAVNLETETIYTTAERQRELFDFVLSLMKAGTSKTVLADGRLSYETVQALGLQKAKQALSRLRRELTTSREIQLPLFAAQKPKEETEK